MHTQIIQTQSTSLPCQKPLLSTDITRTPPKAPLNDAKTVNSSGDALGKEEKRAWGERMERNERRKGSWEDGVGVWEWWKEI
jgi:hypothetical protein